MNLKSTYGILNCLKSGQFNGYKYWWSSFNSYYNGYNIRSRPVIIFINHIKRK